MKMSQVKTQLILMWLFIIFMLMCMCGCAKSTNPVSDINDGIQQSVTELENYANHNMVMDADKKLLLRGAKDCAARADGMAKTCEANIEKCQTENGKLKIERNGLGGIVILLLLWMLKSPLKSIGKKFLGL